MKPKSYYDSTQYLLDRGWSPSPSSSHPCAWENPGLMRVDADDEYYRDVYSPGTCRTWFEDAQRIQLIHDVQNYADE